MKERRALITGFTGFTGHYLAGELEKSGMVVFGTDAKPQRDSRSYQVDLLDKPGLAQVIREVQPTFVVHLAAIAFVGHGNANDFYQVNVIGTRNLLEALAMNAVGVKCVLLASSANVYGNAHEGMLSEEVLPKPANDYAVSKLAMEYVARLWMDRLPIVIARPFNYTGVGQSREFLIPKIVDHFCRRAPCIELGNLDVWRDFSDVRAVVDAYRALLEASPVGQVFNICSGKAYSLREILEMLERISLHKMTVTVNPAFVRSNEVKYLSGDPAKLTGLVGARVVPALEKTLAWMLEEREVGLHSELVRG